MKVCAENKNTAQQPRSLLCGAVKEPGMHLWADGAGLSKITENLYSQSLPVGFMGSLLLWLCHTELGFCFLRSLNFGCPRCGPDIEIEYRWFVEGHTEHLYFHWKCDFCLQNSLILPDAHT